MEFIPIEVLDSGDYTFLYNTIRAKDIPCLM